MSDDKRDNKRDDDKRDGSKKEGDAGVVSRYAGRNYYAVFGVAPGAPLRDIQRAYRALALKVHPDRNGNSPESTRDFQVLSHMMETLSDPDKRSIYDLTGDDGDSDQGDAADIKRCVQVFQRVTAQDIEAFRKHYVGSADEVQDVLNAYERFRGDFSKMLEWIPLAEAEHAPRYKAIIQHALQSKTAKPFALWTTSTVDAKTRAYANKYAHEAQEAESLKEQLAQKYKPYLPKPKITPAPKQPPPTRKPTTKRDNQKPNHTSETDTDDSDSDNEDDDDASDNDADADVSGDTNGSEGGGGEDGGGGGGGGGVLAVVDGGGGGLVLGSLGQSMRQREMARQKALVASLEQRYGKRKRGQVAKNLPTEAEFQRIQQRLLATARARNPPRARNKKSR